MSVENMKRRASRLLRYSVKYVLKRLPLRIVLAKYHSQRPRIIRDSKTSLLIGPSNFAGQGWQWARATEKFCANVKVVSQSLDRGIYTFDADYVVPVAVYRNSRWGKNHFEWIKHNFNHILIDGMRPLTGPLFSEDCFKEVYEFIDQGINVGLIAHGSDIRIPSVHADLYPESPFRAVQPEMKDYVTTLELQAQKWNKAFNEFPGSKFVSTLDLLDFSPNASWLPVTVEIEKWESSPSINLAKPVVVHAPTNPFLKGSNSIDETLRNLSNLGMITYKRVEGVSPNEFRAIINSADVVVDQTALGFYGVTSIESMAAGRLTIAHVSKKIRGKLPDRAEGIIESTAGNLHNVIIDILRNPDEYLLKAKTGPKYVSEVHSGRASAQVICDFLRGSSV